MYFNPKGYTMKPFEPSKHLLDYNEMDSTHQEFLDIYNSVDSSDAQSYRMKLMELLEHSKRHFAFEENLMDTTEYKRSREHKDEHAKVLAEMEYFIKSSNSKLGLRMLQAYYKEKLPDWFDLHLISMDSDLAHHLKS